jgi:hypothetical protein
VTGLWDMTKLNLDGGKTTSAPIASESVGHIRENWKPT